MPESLRSTIKTLEEYGHSKIAVEWVPDDGYNYLNIKRLNPPPMVLGEDPA
jgi:hypothetical protein